MDVGRARVHILCIILTPGHGLFRSEYYFGTSGDKNRNQRKRILIERSPDVNAKPVASICHKLQKSAVNHCRFPKAASTQYCRMPFGKDRWQSVPNNTPTDIGRMTVFFKSKTIRTNGVHVPSGLTRL